MCFKRSYQQVDRAPWVENPLYTPTSSGGGVSAVLICISLALAYGKSLESMACRSPIFDSSCYPVTLLAKPHTVSSIHMREWTIGEANPLVPEQECMDIWLSTATVHANICSTVITGSTSTTLCSSEVFPPGVRPPATKAEGSSIWDIRPPTLLVGAPVSFVTNVTILDGVVKLNQSPRIPPCHDLLATNNTVTIPHLDDMYQYPVNWPKPIGFIDGMTNKERSHPLYVNQLGAYSVSLENVTKTLPMVTTDMEVCDLGYTIPGDSGNGGGAQWVLSYAGHAIMPLEVSSLDHDYYGDPGRILFESNHVVMMSTFRPAGRRRSSTSITSAGMLASSVQTLGMIMSDILYEVTSHMTELEEIALESITQLSVTVFRNSIESWAASRVIRRPNAETCYLVALEVHRDDYKVCATNPNDPSTGWFVPDSIGLFKGVVDPAGDSHDIPYLFYVPGECDMSDESTTKTNDTYIHVGTHFIGATETYHGDGTSTVSLSILPTFHVSSVEYSSVTDETRSNSMNLSLHSLLIDEIQSNVTYLDELYQSLGDVLSGYEPSTVYANLDNLSKAISSANEEAVRSNDRHARLVESLVNVTDSQASLDIRITELEENNTIHLAQNISHNRELIHENAEEMVKLEERLMAKIEAERSRIDSHMGFNDFLNGGFFSGVKGIFGHLLSPAAHLFHWILLGVIGFGLLCVIISLKRIGGFNILPCYHSKR